MRTFKDRNFLIMIYYEGPWERLSNFLIGMRRDHTLRWDIPSHPVGWRKLLSRLSTWAETRDAIWRAKYAIKRKHPHERWSRREP